MKKIIIIMIIIALFLNSCKTMNLVTIDSNIQGADVFIDGEFIGQTPISLKLSNAIWESPDVIIRKDGYYERHSEIEKDIVGFNLVVGAFFFMPSLLFCYGPEEYQYFTLAEEN